MLQHSALADASSSCRQQLLQPRADVGMREGGILSPGLVRHEQARELARQVLLFLQVHKVFVVACCVVRGSNWPGRHLQVHGVFDGACADVRGSKHCTRGAGPHLQVHGVFGGASAEVRGTKHRTRGHLHVQQVFSLVCAEVRGSNRRTRSVGVHGLPEHHLQTYRVGFFI